MPRSGRAALQTYQLFDFNFGLSLLSLNLANRALDLSLFALQLALPLAHHLVRRCYAQRATSYEHNAT